MNEEALTHSDRVKIKRRIRLSFLRSLLAVIILFAIVILIFGIAVLIFGTPVSGFRNRILFIFVITAMPFIFYCLKSLLGCFDLFYGKKIVLTATEYVITNKKHGSYLVVTKPTKMKYILEQESNAIAVNNERPLFIMVTKFSKQILFTSQEKENPLNIYH